MEKTDPRIPIQLGEYQEFVDFDPQGNPVILRSNVPVEERSSENSDEENDEAQHALEPSGLVRFFLDIENYSKVLCPGRGGK